MQFYEYRISWHVVHNRSCNGSVIPLLASDHGGSNAVESAILMQSIINNRVDQPHRKAATHTRVRAHGERRERPLLGFKEARIGTLLQILECVHAHHLLMLRSKHVNSNVALHVGLLLKEVFCLFYPRPTIII